MRYKVMNKSELGYKPNAGADLTKAKTEVYKYVDIVKSGTKKLEQDVKSILSRSELDNDFSSNMYNHIHKLVAEIWRYLNLAVKNFDKGDIYRAWSWLERARTIESIRMNDAFNPAFYKDYSHKDANSKRVSKELIASYRKLADQADRQYPLVVAQLKAWQRANND